MCVYIYIYIYTLVLFYLIFVNLLNFDLRENSERSVMQHNKNLVLKFFFFFFCNYLIFTISNTANPNCVHRPSF